MIRKTFVSITSESLTIDWSVRFSKNFCHNSYDVGKDTIIFFISINLGIFSGLQEAFFIIINSGG